jgi:hypothetical protein
LVYAPSLDEPLAAVATPGAKSHHFHIGHGSVIAVGRKTSSA